MLKQQIIYKDDTDQYIQQLKSGSNAILVTVRVRPLNQKQLQISDFETIKILDGKIIVILDPGNQFFSNDILRKNRTKQIQYAFDFVFQQNISTKIIYDSAINFIIDGVIEGYNAMILAYGATGCGKTYTMIGSNEEPGLMPLSMIDLLSRINEERRSKQILIKVSYIQIYNENIKDLLISQDKNFDIRQDPKQGFVIPGITQVSISTINQLNTVLKVGNRNRSKQMTGANDQSSRSHAILQVIVESKNKAQSTIQETVLGKLNLVDLAGSERAVNTTNKGMRMVQGAKINQSLLVLGNCIQALSEANQKGLKKAFIPYRGSKLTRILKDSLGGNCRTIMVANVSPFIQSFEDSYNTLLYANRAKSIKNNAIRNVLNVETHLSNYVNVINNLKKQNQQLKSQLQKKQFQFNKKNSLPLIQGQIYNLQIQKIQDLIQQHFKLQLKLLQKIYQFTEQIQKIAFQLFKLDLYKNQNQQVLKDQKINKKNLIAELLQLKQQTQYQLDQKINLRGNLIKQIKSNDIIGQVGQPYLISIYKQKKTQVQLYQINQKQKIFQLQKRQKQLIIEFMKKQIKVRQKIIQDQKIIIQKNNIINRITYSKIKYIDQKIVNISNEYLPKQKYARKARLTDEKSQSQINVYPALNSNPSGSIKKKKAPIKNILQKIQQKYPISPSQRISIDPKLIYKQKKPYFNKKYQWDDSKDSHSQQRQQKSKDLKRVGLIRQKKQQRKKIDKNDKKKDKVFDIVFMNR